jgi:hypothetical protein
MKPNTAFKLNVRDISMIEHALRDRQHKVSMYRLSLENSDLSKLADIELKEIADLLGRIHDQKEWYNASGLM